MTPAPRQQVRGRELRSPHRTASYRVHRQCPGDGDALLLAAGQLERGTRRSSPRARPRCSPAVPRLGLGRRGLFITLRWARVTLLSASRCGNEVELLEHHADPSTETVNARLGSWTSATFENHLAGRIGSSRWFTHRSRVDLPEPARTNKRRPHPRSTDKSMPLSTSRTPKCLCRSMIWMAADHRAAAERFTRPVSPNT